MKEVYFIRNNISKWERIETMAADIDGYSPDDIADAYTDITADLAFAYTNYPDSKITLYLNNLAAVLHNAIYRNKREKWSRMITFWTHEVPLTMHQERHMLATAFIILAVSCLIGCVSQMGDTEFVRSILGNGYVDQTLKNIQDGKPVDVYSTGGELSSFLGITLNNIGVAFNEFASGLLTAFGTATLLLYNGVMLGCFMTLFAQHGVFWDAFFAVFLHGTLEMSVIVVAGAAGLTLGKGMLFPGTYSRLAAFRRGAKRGLKIVVGTVPVFVVAGFVEGFLTRHTEVGNLPRLLFIVLCMAFVVYYFVLLPRKRAGLKMTPGSVRKLIKKHIGI